VSATTWNGLQGFREERATDSAGPLEPPPDLWTVGYEGRELAAFLELLHERNIESLIDVRELPLSRRRGFSKSSLGDALSRAGIQYIHLRALGSPRALRHRYKAGGERSAFMADYSAHLSRQQEALSILIALVATTTLAIMCFENDYRDCHRSVIGQHLADSGLQVGHL
jgi:uncharacterized protein (DUF488 family)